MSNADNPLDLTTDGRLLADLADDMTDAVLEAMRAVRDRRRRARDAGRAQPGRDGRRCRSPRPSAARTPCRRRDGGRARTCPGPSPRRRAGAALPARRGRSSRSWTGRRTGSARRVTVVTRDLSATGGPAAPSVAGGARRAPLRRDRRRRPTASWPAAPGMRAFDARRRGRPRAAGHHRGHAAVPGDAGPGDRGVACRRRCGLVADLGGRRALRAAVRDQDREDQADDRDDDAGPARRPRSCRSAGPSRSPP